MKYLFLALLLGAAFYHFSNMQMWTDEVLTQGLAANSDKYCSNAEMLKNYDITKERCMTVYASSLLVCAAKAEKKFPGETYHSQEEFVESGDDIISCINEDLERN